MLRWPNNPGIMGDDPPYLAVGTEVSAKYKGAFCEAKVSKVVHSVKCKVVYKLGLGSAIVTDDQIRGPLRVGSAVEVKHSEKKDYVEATISKIQDCSQYTVVFDDGDITTLRRTALCLKSGRHFAESETLDQLPLTHPEHFGNPVVGGRRGGRRSRNAGSNESSDDEEPPQKGNKSRNEKEADIGKVVCVEMGDKKRKDTWFPGLVVSPTAQDVVPIRVKEDYLVRSFKDGRYFTVPKKEVTEFTREIGAKVDNNTLKAAVEKALLYMDRNELPPHWDRDLIFGLGESALSSVDSDAGNSDSDSSDDEPREEKDHFVAQLYKFMDDRGTPINRGPVIANRDVDLYKLFKVVHKLGGYNRVTNHNQWKTVSHKLGFGQLPNTSTLVKYAYKSFLQKFEEFYRKLGCTMVNHPRGNRARHRGGRNLIRDRDRATPTITSRSDNKDKDQGDDDGDGTESREELTDDKEKEKEDESTRRERKSTGRAKEVSQGEDERPPRGGSREVKRDVKSVRKDEKGSTPGTTEVVRPPSGAVPLDVTTPKTKALKKTATGSPSAPPEARRMRTAQKKKADDSGTLDDEDDSVNDGDDDDSEKGDKATNTRSKSKEDVTRLKKEVTPVELRNRQEGDKKASRTVEASDKKSARPTPGPSTDKRAQRPSLAMTSDRKTVRSLAAEFEKKAARPGTSDSEKKSDDKKKAPEEKKSRPTVAAAGEKRAVKAPTSDNDKAEKKIRSVLPLEPERKKVRPSLTANPEKKKVDSDKRDADQRSQSADGSGDSEADRKIKTKRKKDSDDTETFNVLPSYKNVAVGDKLKVYYGPTHEHKVTYEAKVLEVRGEGQDASYLVHYTGWNTRYDEWIKRGRIADNLSWNPARAKRRHQAQLAGSGKKVVTKRAIGTKAPARDSSSPQQSAVSRDSQPPRSTTPSSVTSSSSRTKSPATRPGSARLARHAESTNAPVESTRRRRTRRISGHLDISAASESESEAYESESETEPSQKKTGKKTSENEESTAVKKRIPRRAEVEEDDEDEEEEEDRESDEKAKRPRRTPRLHAEPKVETAEVKVEPEPEEAPPLEASRGRDFDLNQIRSELKGIDRTVKLPSEDKAEKATEKSETAAEKPKEKSEEVVCKTEPGSADKTVERAVEKTPAKVTVEVEEDMEEDIYEFKEPEPFEFEVRGKRDSPVDSNKIGKRPLGMTSPGPKVEPWNVDSLDTKPEKAAPPKKRALTTPLTTPPTSPMKNSDLDSASDEGSPSRRRYRRTLTRTREIEEKVETPPVPTPVKTEPAEAARPQEVMSPQKRLMTSVEEQFKLWQMPNYHSIRPGSTSSSTVTSLTKATTTPETPTSPPALAALSEPYKVTVTTPTQSDTPPAKPSESPKTSTAAKTVPVLSPPPDKVPESPSRGLPALESIQERGEQSAVEKSPKREQPTPEPPHLLPIFGGSPKATFGSPVKPEKMPLIKQQEEEEEGEEEEEESEEEEEERSMDEAVETNVSPKRRRRRRRKASLRLTKKSLRSEFVDESDSESSTGSRRLVIDPSGSSYWDSDSDSNSPAADSEMKDVDEKILGSKEMIPHQSQSTTVTTTELESEEAVSTASTSGSSVSSIKAAREIILGVTVLPTVKTESSVASSLGPDHPTPVTAASVAQTSSPTVASTTTPAAAPPSVSPTVPPTAPPTAPTTVPTTVPPSAPSPAPSPAPTTAPSTTGAPTDDETTEEGDQDSSLRSLLCEETIPGSPAPHTESAADSAVPDKIPGSSAVNETERVVEMPFASAPNSSASSAPLLQLREEICGESVTQTNPSPPAGGASTNNPHLVNNQANNIEDNSPPTTPDSSLSTLSTSPRDERADSPPLMKDSKSLPTSDGFDANRVSLLIEEDMARPTRRPAHLASKVLEREPLSERPRDTPGSRRDGPGPGGRREIPVRQSSSRHFERNRCDEDPVDLDDRDDSQIVPKKRRRSLKVSESEERIVLPAKRSRVMGRQVKVSGAGSDSDENIDPDCGSSVSVSLPPTGVDSRSSTRPSKYNFYVELPPELDSTERIALIMQKIQELRKTYMAVKSELATIDRRRKKLRRRDREDKAASKEACA